MQEKQIPGDGAMHTDDFFENDFPMDASAVIGAFAERAAMEQSEEHPDFKMPENTIVHKLLTAEQDSELCDRIADIIITSPRRYREELLAGFVERMSVDLEYREGPPKSYVHPSPPEVVKDFARSQTVYLQVIGKIEAMEYELRQGELGRVVGRVAGAMRNILKR